MKMKEVDYLTRKFLYLFKFRGYVTWKFKNKKNMSYVTRTSDETSDRTNAFITGLDCK